MGHHRETMKEAAVKGAVGGVAGTVAKRAMPHQSHITTGHRHETPMGAVVKGAIAGLAGTIVMTYAMQTVPRLMERAKAGGGRAGQPSGGEESPKPPEQLARKVGTEVMEEPVGTEQAKQLGQAIHWSYGMGWGVLAGLIQGTFFPSPLKFGVLLGTFVWAVGPNWLLPLFKIGPEPSEQPVEKTAMQWGFHVLFGVTTALSFAAMEGEI